MVYSGFGTDHAPSKGYTIKIDTRNQIPLERTFSYKEIARRICNYIKADELFLDGEKEAYPQWKQDKEERNAAYNAFQEELKEPRKNCPVRKIAIIHRIQYYQITNNRSLPMQW